MPNDEQPVPSAPPAPPPDGVIRWSSCPFADEPWSKTSLLLVILAVTISVAAWIERVYGVLAAGLLLIGLGPYFFRTRYEVSADGGVKVRFPLFTRSRPWSLYKRYVVQRGGIFLSQFPAPSRLDSFRGDFLRYAPDAPTPVDREALLALVRQHVPSTKDRSADN